MKREVIFGTMKVAAAITLLFVGFAVVKAIENNSNSDENLVEVVK